MRRTLIHHEANAGRLSECLYLVFSDHLRKHLHHGCCCATADVGPCVLQERLRKAEGLHGSEADWLLKPPTIGPRPVPPNLLRLQPTPAPADLPIPGPPPGPPPADHPGPTQPTLPGPPHPTSIPGLFFFASGRVDFLGLATGLSWTLDPPPPNLASTASFLALALALVLALALLALRAHRRGSGFLLQPNQSEGPSVFGPLLAQEENWQGLGLEVLGSRALNLAPGTIEEC